MLVKYGHAKHVFHIVGAIGAIYAIVCLTLNQSYTQLYITHSRVVRQWLMLFTKPFLHKVQDYLR